MKKSLTLLLLSLACMMMNAQQPLLNHFYMIQNKNSGKYLELKDASEEDGAEIIQSDYTGQKAQYFKLFELNGDYRISPVVSGKCFDIKNAAPTENLQVYQWSCYSEEPQQFEIVPHGNEGYFQIRLVKTGMCLGIKDQSAENGATLQQEFFRNRASQLWKFTEGFPFGYVNGIVASQVGYRTNDPKKGVLLLDENLLVPQTFSVVDATSNEDVYSGEIETFGEKWKKMNFIADFSELTVPGNYVIKAGDYISYPFVISDDVWKKNTRHEEYLSSFMNFQRSTEEKEPTETNIFAYTKVGETGYDALGFSRDLRYGWFSATSHDKHMTEQSASLDALLYAYLYNPDFFSDNKTGDIPAILDEARFSLDFVLKMQDTDGGFFTSVHPGRSPWEPETMPSDRYLVANKGTGVSARATGSLALGYSVFKNVDPEYARVLLTAARKGFVWLNAHPDQYLSDEVRPVYWSGCFDSWLLAAVEMYISLKDEQPDEAETYKAFVEQHLNSGSMNNQGIWNSAGAGRDYGYEPYWLNDQIISGDIAFVLSRYYPYAKDASKIKVKADLVKLASYWKKNDNYKNPYGWADKMMVPWFGACGYFAQAAAKFLLAGYSLDDEALVNIGKSHIQALYGTNPFAKTYVYGEGTNTFQDLFARPAEGSIGAILPGIKVLDKVPEGTTIDERMPLDDYRIQGPDYSTGESCVPYTPLLIFGLALMDNDQYFVEKDPVVQSGHTYVFKCKGDLSKVCAVANASTDNGGNCLVKTYDASAPEQQWTAYHVQGNFYKFVNVNSGKCLEIAEWAEGEEEDGRNLQQGEYKGSDFQLWDVTMESDGFCTLKCKAAVEAVVEVYNGWPGEDVNLQQWTAYGGSNQAFAIVEVNPTNIDNVSVQEFKVYPNPVRGTSLRIINEKPDMNEVFTDVQIMDVHGKSVFHDKVMIGGAFNEVNIGRLPAGVYVLQLVKGKATLHMQKLIVL